MAAADSRTVDEIIQEVEELRKTGEDDGRPGVRFLSEEGEYYYQSERLIRRTMARCTCLGSFSRSR